MSNRLEILQKSLEKKQELFDSKLDSHIADVKSANGQPLGDKRNGPSTIRRWERQMDTLRGIDQSIKTTKRAIEKEEYKIAVVADMRDKLPAAIIEMVERGELNQWRKHPNSFFVPGVDRARIVWDIKRRFIGQRYFAEVTDMEQRKKFAEVFNALCRALNNQPKDKIEGSES